MFRLHYADMAIDTLAELWMAAGPDLRRAMTEASHRIDETLRDEADTAGESRIGPWRVLLDDPLGVIYRVEPDGQTVSVVRIWLRHRPG